MRKDSEMKNKVNYWGFFAFFCFAPAFILHTILIYNCLPSLLAIPVSFLIVALYLSGVSLGILAWVKHFSGSRMGFANMIFAGLSIMPLLIGIAIYIRILLYK
jgi:hypothetical protein